MTDPSEALKLARMIVAAGNEYGHGDGYHRLFGSAKVVAQALIESMVDLAEAQAGRDRLAAALEQYSGLKSWSAYQTIFGREEYLTQELAEAREDTARLTLAREAIEVALDRLSVDGDCFDFEGLTNHLRGALAAIDAAKGKE